VLEVKSAGRLVGDVGLVPDAPSSRAARHVNELLHLHQTGLHTVLVVVAQGDAASVAIDGTIDPVLAQAVQAAQHAGVQLIGVSATFNQNGLYFKHTIPFGR
jgi:sugar fermentation stimulation protein A